MKNKISHWRDLAMQLDMQRMAALSHLRCMVENAAIHHEQAKSFLSNLPLDAEALLTKRTNDLALVWNPDSLSQTDADTHWRRLAFQFDAHRLSAINHLQNMLEDPANHLQIAAKFIEEAPENGNDVLLKRLNAVMNSNVNA